MKNLKRGLRTHLSFLIIISIIVLLRKGVYPYEYMDDWEKFDHSHKTRKDSLETRAEPAVFSS